MYFTSIVTFILNFVKWSLQLELDDFFNDLNGKNMRITKQAFSKARKKISPVAFIKLSDKIVDWFYKDNNSIRYRGYRLLGIDGTVLEINNSDELRKKFGYITNQFMEVIRARDECLYDLNNDMILAAGIGHYRSSERTRAQGLINKLENIGFSNDRIIFDRGYPSKEFISFIEAKNIHYLMRVSRSFIKEVVNVKQSDQIVEAKYNGKVIKIRVIKFDLDSDITEILVTNIFDENFTVADFKVLYYKRWGIEVKYNELKSKLQIENFTGETVVAIEQDFYVTVYLSNMAALAKMDVNLIIIEANKDKNSKHEYKVNTNILIGKLKKSLVLMILEDEPIRRSRMLKK